MLASNDKVYSRPLEAFPTLKQATTQQRLAYTIKMQGEALRWENIDEDIHITSFFDTTEPQPQNEIAKIFSNFPQLNVSEIANQIGIHKSLLSQYIYGIKTPSKERIELIKTTLRNIGTQLTAI